MDKYISHKYLDQLLDYYLTNSNGAEHYAYNIIKGEIEHAPTADVVEVKHGRWHLIDFAGTVRCSICGHETLADIPFVDSGAKWVPLYADEYCGNCGAKMEKEN
jgi:hypothetical protein